MNLLPSSLLRILSVTLLAGLLGPVGVIAADTPPEAQPTPNRPRAGAAGGAGGGMRGGMGAGWLDDQQRALLQEAMQNNSQELRKLGEKMREAQKELVQAILAEKQDEKVVREKAEAVAKIDVEQSVLRAKIFAKVVPTLKPEQRDQLENAPFAMQMLTGGGMGGGMRGGGMMRGGGGGMGPGGGGGGGMGPGGGNRPPPPPQ